MIIMVCGASGSGTTSVRIRVKGRQALPSLRFAPGTLERERKRERERERGVVLIITR